MATENTETIAQAAPETPAIPKYRGRLSKRFPDANPQSDQEWDDLAERAYAEDEEKIKLSDENNQVIQDLLDSDKDLALVVSDMLVNGTTFRVALGKHFGPDELEPKEGDDDYEYYQKSAEERKKMGQAFRERGEQKRKNTQEAYDNIDKFAAKKAMDDKAKEEFIGFVNTLYNDHSVLKLSTSTLEKLYKAMTYDEAVAEAAEEAGIDAKNEAIEATRVKKAEAVAGDGVPTPQGGSSPAPRAPKKKAGFFDDLPQKKFQ